MTNPIVLDLPDDISHRAAEIAESTGHPIERVLIDHLKTLTKPAPSLSDEIKAELEALPHLSDDALWTIAREQMPESVQQRAYALLAQQTRSNRSATEKAELEQLIAREIVSPCVRQKQLLC
jgi:hypothetical protein